MIKISSAALMATILYAGAAGATAPVLTPSAETDEIVITGYAKPYKLTGKQLATAVQVFRKYRSTFAPQSTLFFAVKRKSGRDLSGLKLSLRSGSSIIPLTLDTQSRFVLPDLKHREWELVANRGSGGITITPLVLSPGGREFDRMLGNVRLNCEVSFQAIYKPTLPLVLRGMSAAVNPCRSKRVGMYIKNEERPIASATVTRGTVQSPLLLSADRRAWRYPGYDKMLPNSARVHIQYN